MPYFNGNNIAFFKDFVFNGLEDIIGEPISKKTIFRRQTLNENFFGKLIVLPSGDVYANVNCPPVGNILFDSVAKLVYEEMTNSTAWFMLRNAGECNDCINRHLCPSISNYELVTGIMNMCYIRGDRS